MQIFNRTICCTFADFEGICSTNALQCRIKTGTVTVVRKGGGEGRPALIEWASLPERLKRAYIDRHGDPTQAMSQKILRSALVPDATAREFYEHYTYQLGPQTVHLSAELIEQYTTNATVLQELVRRNKERMAMRRALGNGAGEVWQILFRESEDYREVMTHTLPASLPRLKARIKEWEDARQAQGIEAAYRTIISAKVGNANTTKITPEAARLLIALKRSRTPVLSDAQILQRYNEAAATGGWKPLQSVKTLTQWYNDPQNIQQWHDAVHGELATSQLFDRRHQTALPSLRDALWYGDGTKLNLYYRTEDGKVATTSVYEIIDAYSEVLLGYWVSDTEDYEAQYHAFRRAVQRSGHFPFEFVHDNQGGHKKANSAGLFDRSSHVHRSTRPYNGASKTIESVFGRFQQQVLHQYWNFTGQNVTARRATSKPNLEFIAANRASLPTRDELLQQYAQARDEWNRLPHPATGQPRIEMYQASQNPQTEVATEAAIIETFWCRRAPTSSSPRRASPSPSAAPTTATRCSPLPECPTTSGAARTPSSRSSSATTPTTSPPSASTAATAQASSASSASHLPTWSSTAPSRSRPKARHDSSVRSRQPSRTTASSASHKAAPPSSTTAPPPSSRASSSPRPRASRAKSPTRSSAAPAATASSHRSSPARPPRPSPSSPSTA